MWVFPPSPNAFYPMILTKEWIICSKAYFWNMYLKSGWLMYAAFPSILFLLVSWVCSPLSWSGHAFPLRDTLFLKHGSTHEHLFVLEVQTTVKPPPEGSLWAPFHLSVFITHPCVTGGPWHRHLWLLLHHLTATPHSRENDNLYYER